MRTRRLLLAILALTLVRAAQATTAQTPIVGGRIAP
jgi:hypothetical protein